MKAKLYFTVKKMNKKLRYIIFITSLIFCTFIIASGDYNRSSWPHWIDLDDDGQDTRAEILITHSKEQVRYADNLKRERVIIGLWHCPYTNKYFSRASQLDIDHIVPLEHAYWHGAEHWSRSKKTAFANDPLNLLPVYLGANRSKGSKGIDEWLPAENKSYMVKYILRWVQIKEKYDLQYSFKEMLIVSKIINKYNKSN